MATFATAFTNGIPFCETRQCESGKDDITYMDLAEIGMISDIRRETSPVNDLSAADV